jgi:putative DNA primase/helicase
MTGRADDALLIAELATLDPLAYARRRKAAAEELGIPQGLLDRLVNAARNNGSSKPGQGRALTFPDIEPWDEPVDGAGLLGELHTIFGRFVVMSDAARTAAPLWAVHTHVFEQTLITPRLVIKSPQKRSGKTTLLTLLGELVQRPLVTAGLSAASLFRAIELVRPTLLIDEADALTGDSHQELRALLNAGFQRGGQAIRTVPIGDGFEPRMFSCWAPVAVALIGRLWDTLEDRSVRIELQRRRGDEDIERLRRNRLDELAPTLRRIWRWAGDHADALRRADPILPRQLNDRAADCWRILAAIADQAGGDWPDRARAAALLLSEDGADTETVATRLLRDLRELFDAQPSGVLFSEEIVVQLISLEERGWAEMGKARRPLSKVSLARLLERFRIRPDTVRRGNDVAKGYRRDQFEDAWERYL